MVHCLLLPFLRLSINHQPSTTNLRRRELGVERSFDPAGRLASSLIASAPPFRVDYDGTNGLPALVTNAVLTTYYAYDALGHVTNIVYKRAVGTVIRQFALKRDASGMVTQKWHRIGSFTRERDYCSYDALGRLTEDLSSWINDSFVTNSFAYDPAGNRTGASSNGWARAYTYTDNRLVSVSANGEAASPVLCDAAGNVTNFVTRAGVTNALAWDTLGRLVSVSTNGVRVESCVYDALGRRVSTKTGARTVYHLYDGDRCIADVAADGKPLCVYTWGPGTDNLLAVTHYIPGGGTNTYYAVKDHLGSVCLLVDSAGLTKEACRYGAWGETLIMNATRQPLAASAYGNRFLFHGGAYSAATGLYQFRARWYSPELGRWLSPDPIGLEGGLNLYEFCRNNPVNGMSTAARTPPPPASASSAPGGIRRISGDGSPPTPSGLRAGSTCTSSAGTTPSTEGIRADSLQIKLSKVISKIMSSPTGTETPG